jgi:subtilase family serine protease
MKRCLFLALTALVIIIVAASGFAQDPATPANGTIVAPPSTLNRAAGRLHTPLYIFIPAEDLNPGSIPNGETPASIACIYGVTPPTAGCPKNGTVIPSGGAKAIAVVEWGHNTTLQSDLDAFSTHFGLPHVTIEEICSAPPCPISDGTGWDLEAALDVQWAHAMAPHARIIVSTSSVDPITDGAETAAGTAVAAAGGGEVSNSWNYDSPAEFPGELGYDRDMQTPGVVYFASAGDSGLGAAYPSTSPNVVSAGGTHISRDSQGNFTGTESCWSDSGGGISQYELLPHYQFLIQNRTGPHRGTPDLAADADPNTGVLVYNTSLYLCNGWCIVGGTSLSSPLLAGIVNAAGGFRSSTNAELTKAYGEYRIPAQYHTDFFDVTTGSNGAPARVGWDECTGIGSPRKLAGL